MVHRKTLSLPVELLSMAKLNTTKAYGTTTKAVDKIITCSNKEKTKSHGRSKSLFYQGHQGRFSSSLTTKDAKEMPRSMNYFDRASHVGLDCLSQVASCSFDDKTREREDAIDSNDLFDRFTLQKDENEIHFKNWSTSTNNEFNHDSILTFDNKVPIAAYNYNVVSPKVTKRKIVKIKEATPIKTPEDTPTFISSNPRKKMLTSEFNGKCPSFIACDKIPFNTFDLEGTCDTFDSWDGYEDYSYDRSGNIFRSFQLKPRSEYIFENFPERLYIPNLCME